MCFRIFKILFKIQIQERSAMSCEMVRITYEESNEQKLAVTEKNSMLSLIAAPNSSVLNSHLCIVVVRWKNY